MDPLEMAGRSGRLGLGFETPRRRPSIDMEALDEATKNVVEGLLEDLYRLEKKLDQERAERNFAEEFAFELINIFGIDKKESDVYCDYKRAKTQVLLHIGRMFEKIDRR